MQQSSWFLYFSVRSICDQYYCAQQRKLLLTLLVFQLYHIILHLTNAIVLMIIFPKPWYNLIHEMFNLDNLLLYSYSTTYTPLFVLLPIERFFQPIYFHYFIHQRNARHCVCLQNVIQTKIHWKHCNNG